MKRILVSVNSILKNRFAYIFLASLLVPTLAGAKISVYGRFGGNFATKSTFSQTIDSNAVDRDANYVFFYGGGDVFYGGALPADLEVGLSVAWLPLFSTVDSSDENSTDITRGSLYSLPILLEVRKFLMPGLYGGAGLGVAPGLLYYQNDKKDTQYAFALSARAGYDYEIISGLLAGADLHIIYLLQRFEFGDGTVLNGNTVNFAFSAHVGYKI